MQPYSGPRVTLYTRDGGRTWQHTRDDGAPPVHRLEVVDQILEPKRSLGDGALTMAAKVVSDTGEAILKPLNELGKGRPARSDSVNQKKRGTISFDRIGAVDRHR